LKVTLSGIKITGGDTPTSHHLRFIITSSAVETATFGGFEVDVSAGRWLTVRSFQPNYINTSPAWGVGPRLTSYRIVPLLSPLPGEVSNIEITLDRTDYEIKVDYTVPQPAAGLHAIKSGSVIYRGAHGMSPETWAASWFEGGTWTLDQAAAGAAIYIGASSASRSDDPAIKRTRVTIDSVTVSTNQP
jgi:hypothetical protein